MHSPGITIVLVAAHQHDRAAPETPPEVALQQPVTPSLDTVSKDGPCVLLLEDADASCSQEPETRDAHGVSVVNEDWRGLNRQSGTGKGARVRANVPALYRSSSGGLKTFGR